MQISFYDKISKFNGTMTLPLGRLTCDILNDTTDWSAYQNLYAMIDFITPIDDMTVSSYMNNLEDNRATVLQLQEVLRSHCFYRLTDEAEITFNSVLSLIDSLLAKLRRGKSNDDQSVLDIGLQINTIEEKVAIENIGSFYSVHADAIRVFTRLIDDCVMYNGTAPQQRPIERLAAYGMRKLQRKIAELVLGAHTASSTVYAPDYEIVTREDGEKTLAHVVSVNHIAQFMYHEIMNVIMQGHSFRKCKNCGRYFIQYGDRSVEYCDQIPEGASKPCNVIGPTRLFTSSLHDDPIKMTYSRVYKKYIAQRRTGTITDTHFKTWAIQAKVRRTEAYQNQETDVEHFQQDLDALMRQIVERNA